MEEVYYTCYKFHFKPMLKISYNYTKRTRLNCKEPLHVKMSL